MERRNFIKGSILGLLSTVFTIDKKVDAKDFQITESIDYKLPPNYNLLKGSGTITEGVGVVSSGNVSDLLENYPLNSGLIDWYTANPATCKLVDLELVWEAGIDWIELDGRQRVIDKMTYLIREKQKLVDEADARYCAERQLFMSYINVGMSG